MMMMLFLALACASLSLTSLPPSSSTPDAIAPLLLTDVLCFSGSGVPYVDSLSPVDLAPRCHMAFTSYDKSGEYIADVSQVARKVLSLFPPVNASVPGVPAPVHVVVMDVDDTALSTLEILRHYGYRRPSLPVWQEALSYGDLPALPPVLWLYTELFKRGYKIVFITNRVQSLEMPTKLNLKRAGYGEVCPRPAAEQLSQAPGVAVAGRAAPTPPAQPQACGPDIRDSGYPRTQASGRLGGRGLSGIRVLPGIALPDQGSMATTRTRSPESSDAAASGANAPGSDGASGASGDPCFSAIIFKTDADSASIPSVYKPAARALLLTLPGFVGSTLFASIGDQFGDSTGKPEPKYAIKLPNPFYLTG